MVDTTCFSNNRYSVDNFSKKVNAHGEFLTMRATSCVFKGKWVYECTVGTIKLAQIGWCQLNTRATIEQGVGDDNTSFAFDGYRMVYWHAEAKSTYGRLWSANDIIGCAVDLDDGYLEFFINGVSLGKTGSIKKGANKAYFPACSITRLQHVSFAFSNLKYSYGDYKPIDDNLNYVTNSEKVITDLMEVTSRNLFNIPTEMALVLLVDPFSFICEVGLKDSYLATDVIVPLLANFSSEKQRKFLETIVMVKGKQESIKLNESLLQAIANKLTFCIANKEESQLERLFKLLNLFLLTVQFEEYRPYNALLDVFCYTENDMAVSMELAREEIADLGDTAELELVKDVFEKYRKCHTLPDIKDYYKQLLATWLEAKPGCLFQIIETVFKQNNGNLMIEVQA